MCVLSRFFAFCLVIFFLLVGYIAYTAVTLPSVHRALEAGVEPSQTSQVLAADHSVIMAYGKFQHRPLPLDQMPQNLINALIATEDRRFYSHRGIDMIGTGRAIFRDIRSHGIHEGGSTITQQLARNIFLSNERSLQRKVKEALLALKLEQQLNKSQILEMYLNNVYFGEGAYGVAAASNIYFGKKPKQMTQAECALLAGLPQAPSLYNPFANPELALKRRHVVINNLVETGHITQSQAQRLEAAPLHLNPNGRSISSSDKAPFFNHYVIQSVMQTLDIDEQTFWNQGLKVYTTLDSRAQGIAVTQVNALSRSYGRTSRNQQAALFSLDANGRILAYVGGKNYSVSQFDRVSQARRQAGSLFKAFVYATAIEHGMTPQTVYRDAPVEYGPWRPMNYDRRFHGYMTLARALAHSDNIIAIKLTHDLTPDAVIQEAHRFGVQAPMDPNLSIALGTADVSLKEMTTAFSVFNNDGMLVAPYGIEKIVDHDGHVLYQHTPSQTQILQRNIRDTMVEMMEGVVKYGTGHAADIGFPMAGKTGTTDDDHDAWFIGYTPGYTTGVWVGNDDNTGMPNITGGTIPARIWHAYMAQLLAGEPKRDFNLESALPLAQKDFFVFNLDNLNPTDKGGSGTIPHGEQSSEPETDNSESPAAGSGGQPPGVLPGTTAEPAQPGDPNLNPTGNASPLPPDAGSPPPPPGYPLPPPNPGTNGTEPYPRPGTGGDGRSGSSQPNRYFDTASSAALPTRRYILNSAGAGRRIIPDPANNDH